MQFFSRAGQDRYVLESFFRGRRRGTFLDVDAGKDSPLSNTRFFERSMDWTGLCIGADAGEHRSNVMPLPAGGLRAEELEQLLAQHGLRSIDFFSLRADGAEQALLAQLDLERLRVAVLCVANAGAQPGGLHSMMEGKGYELVARLGGEDVYRRLDVPRLPRTTVITAVWHKDPLRWDLLRGHQQNLDGLQQPVDRCYVFDNGEQAPGWLSGNVISARGPLTIYQAWNLALSQVETPFVMNLNLDDRLAPDAVGLLEKSMLEQQASLIGGEWSIEYTQQATDAVRCAYPATELPFDAAWPPTGGVRTRLGSGTGERGTYGPAVMWRMDTHIGAPRYPWRMADGTRLINHGGDLGWWLTVERHLKKKTARLPMVIGNYYSHPGQQLDFRRTGNDEHALLASDIGLSLL